MDCFQLLELELAERQVLQPRESLQRLGLALEQPERERSELCLPVPLGPLELQQVFLLAFSELLSLELLF